MRRAANTKPKNASKARVAVAVKKSPARRVARRATPAKLTLAADCTLREAAGLKSRLLSTVSPTDQVILEGGAVERIDAAALQLLVAFARREAAAGRRLVWDSASSELIGASARLGLLDVLSLPAPPEGSP
jgi:phospholipid transport system transporter-binding protein